MRPRFANLLLPLVTAVLAGCAAVHNTIPPGIAVPDADGHPVRPLAAKDAVAVVFVFLANDCPIANRSIPELLRLEEAYASRGVKFWPVHAGADESDASVRGHAKEYGLTTVPLRDPDDVLRQQLDSSGFKPLMKQGETQRRLLDPLFPTNPPPRRNIIITPSSPSATPPPRPASSSKVL